INVLMDSDRLRAYNLTVTDVTRALQTQNAELPAGRVEQGDTSLALGTRGRVQSVAAFGDLVIRQQDGHAVLLRDVATVEDGMAEAPTQAHPNGEAGGLPTV